MQFSKYIVPVYIGDEYRGYGFIVKDYNKKHRYSLHLHYFCYICTQNA